MHFLVKGGASLGFAAFVVLVGLKNVFAQNFSPSSRILSPERAWRGRPRVANTSVFPATLQGKDSYIVLDFGKEVGGVSTPQFSCPFEACKTTFGNNHRKSFLTRFRKKLRV